MEKIKLRVQGNQIEVVERPAVITSGTVGLEVEFAFDSQWEDLSKTVVFQAGEKVVATSLTEERRIVPWEVLEKPKQWLCIGVYGANRDGTVVIPTVWAKIAVIHTGTDPEGDPALDPTAHVWQEALCLAEKNAAAVEKAVKALAPDLCQGMDDPELRDALTALMEYGFRVEYTLDEHLLDKENPHGITCEQIRAVTKEQHDKDIKDAKDWAEQLQGAVWQEIENVRGDIYNDIYVKDEVDAKVAESKAVIVTVSGTTPSHTSQEIYALIQAGKVVYLELWGNTYIICSACTESEAKFENSIVSTIAGADGKTYNVQRFRLYFIKNDRYSSPQIIESPSIEYLDAAIAALNQ